MGTNGHLRLAPQQTTGCWHIAFLLRHQHTCIISLFTDSKVIHLFTIFKKNNSSLHGYVYKSKWPGPMSTILAMAKSCGGLIALMCPHPHLVVNQPLTSAATTVFQQICSYTSTFDLPPMPVLTPLLVRETIRHEYIYTDKCTAYHLQTQTHNC